MLGRFVVVRRQLKKYFVLYFADEEVKDYAPDPPRTLPQPDEKVVEKLRSQEEREKSQRSRSRISSRNARRRAVDIEVRRNKRRP